MEKGNPKNTSFTGPLNERPKRPRIYYRRQDHLSARDRADLEAYAEVLRGYYDIPEGEPVFPDIDERANPADQERDKPAPSPKRRATGVNGDNHPWRGTL